MDVDDIMKEIAPQINKAFEEYSEWVMGLKLDTEVEIEITDVNPLTGNNEPFYLCDLQDDEEDNNIKE